MVFGMSEIFTYGMARIPRRPLPRPKFRRTYIAQWREYRNLTQEQLADRLEMTQSHLSMLENGKRGYTQETLEAVAEALQTDVASLLMRDPSAPDAIWSIWDQAKAAEREKIEEYAGFIVKSRAGSQ
jgi:transcriptional regulator with XRE-family HTH domain